MLRKAERISGLIFAFAIALTSGMTYAQARVTGVAEAPLAVAGGKVEPSESQYVSPYVEKGLPGDAMRTMLMDPGLANSVRNNRQLWLNGIMRMGLYIRPRSEIRENLNFSSSNTEKINRISQNAQLWFFLNPAKDVEMKITMQDSRVWGGEAGAASGNAYSHDDRGYFFSNGNNGNTRDALAVREAYLKYSNVGVAGLGIQVGRQVLIYGDQRMLGGANWNVNGLSYDGVVIKYGSKYFDTDLIGVKASAKDAAPNGITSDTSANDDAYLAGLYNSLKFDFAVIDVYGLGMFRHLAPDTVLGTAPLSASQQQSNLYTFGARITNRTAGNKLPVGDRWDYTIEGAFQLGNAPDIFFTNSTGTVTSNSRYYNGKFLFAQTGYKVLDEVRIGAHVYYSPGTEDRTGSSINTFQTMPGPRFGGFPYLNVFNGLSENMGMKNIFSPSISVSYESKKWGDFILSYFHENKATNQDAWYGISGAANTSASSTTAGRISTEDATNSGTVALGNNIYQEVDLVWMKQFGNYVSIWVGFGYLHAGNAVSLARGADFKSDAYMGFIQLTGAL